MGRQQNLLDDVLYVTFAEEPAPRTDELANPGRYRP